MTQKRLSRELWLKAGIAALATGGADVLGAEPLARKLGTTKGSFYWHFTDVPTFHQALLDRWKRDAFAQIVAEMEGGGGAVDRLRRFGVLLSGDETGAAMRIWAATNTRAAAVVAQVDEERLTYITALLSGLGVTHTGYPLAIYASLIGGQHIDARGPERTRAAYDALVDLVLALR